MSESLILHLQQMRRYYQTGETRSYSFRNEQLKKLRNTINKYEEAIADALYNDLKKSPEEAYATERGLLLAEINLTLKNLYYWMRPKIAGTDLANFPSGSKIYQDPLGTVLIISPWNYPLQLLLIPLVGAIAGGNCAILKPSELAPATAALIEKMITEIFPSEYVMVVQGDGSDIVPAMMNNFRFDHVFYTGSTQVGRSIYKMAAEQLVPVTLELGGKSPAIVDRDTNISVAARRIVLGKFINAGQTCIAPDYVLAHQEVKADLIRKLNEAIIEFYTTDPASSYDYPKIINEKRFDKLISYMKEGRVVIGGHHDKTKLFIAPTIMDNVSMGSSLMNEEIFGPILPVIAYHSMEEAMQMEELNADPLAFYLFTNTKSVEKKWLERTAFGGGCINNTVWQFANHHLPFGGVGNSGIGAYHGKYTFERFTRSKPVLKTPTWFDPSLKYPSMKGRLKFFKWIIR